MPDEQLDPARQDAQDPPLDGSEGPGASPSEKRFSSPVLSGRHVYLRSVTPEDFKTIQHMEMSDALAVRWRLRGATPGPGQWAEMTTRSVLAQFLVISRKRNVPLGLVVAYKANFQYGHAYLAATSFTPAQRSPLMVWGIYLFIRYVFSCWNFHKLYMEVPEYNLGQFASGVDRLFTIEGRLRDHSFYDGERWDEYLLALYRDDWQRAQPRLLAIELDRPPVITKVRMPSRPPAAR